MDIIGEPKCAKVASTPSLVQDTTKTAMTTTQKVHIRLPRALAQLASISKQYYPIMSSLRCGEAGSGVCLRRVEHELRESVDRGGEIARAEQTSEARAFEQGGLAPRGHAKSSARDKRKRRWKPDQKTRRADTRCLPSILTDASYLAFHASARNPDCSHGMRRRAFPTDTAEPEDQRPRVLCSDLLEFMSAW